MNAGGAASVINFSNTALGSFGMFLGTLGWTNYVFGIGCIAIIGTLFSYSLWLYFQRKNYQLDGL